MSVSHKITLVLSSSLLSLIMAGCQGAGSDTGESTAELSSANPGGDGSARPGRGPGGPGGHGPDRLFEKFDTDKDGAIVIADLPEPMREHLARADANKDGKLTRDELQKLWDSKEKALDTNGDGTISDEERAAAHAKFMAERFAEDDKNKDGFLTADEVGARRWEHMKAADANGDGKLTKDELETAIKNGTLKPPHGGPGHRGHGPMGPMGR